MAKSLCRLLIYVNNALVVNFNIANLSFKAIRENKILAKISKFTVFEDVHMYMRKVGILNVAFHFCLYC